MNIMNRTVLESTFHRFKNFLDDWQLRVFVLLSLFLHVVLVLLGSRRKYITKKLPRSFVRLGYSSTDFIAAIYAGLVANCQGYWEDNSLQQKNMIQTFWAPFVLLHLAGPDTITADSLDDIELWKRHFFGLFMQTLQAISISLTSWKGTALNILAIPMFLAGLTKYGEKTLFLRSRSKCHFRKPMIPRPDPGPSYAGFMEEYDFKRAQGSHVSLPPVIEKSEVLNIIPSPAPRNKSIPNADLLQTADEFFAKFKCLFTDLNLEPEDLNESKFFFKDKSWTEAFKVIEIQLGFMYDILYTKAMVAYPKWGGLRRFIYLYFTIPTFMAFLIIDKHKFSTIDVIITFLLLVGAIVVEIYSIILMFSSDWTMTWLSKQEKTRVYYICQAISSCRVPFLFPANKRWSDSMAKYSIISHSLKILPTKLIEVWKFFCICQKLEELSSENPDVVPKYLKRLIFEQLKEKSAILWQSDKLDIEAAKKFCARRGDWTLEKMNCFGIFSWSIGGEFDKSILLWHLATDLCYYTDLNKNSSPVKNSNCKSSKLLSDYMVHLLVKRPLMLHEGNGQIRFQESCAEVTEVFRSGKPVKDRIQACKKLLQWNTEIPPKERRRMSVLFDACRLAKSLQSLETEEEWGRERKWEMISHVWVEMLCYAACHCPQDHHAEELSLGGQLLTHVWFLMAHFGITERISQA